MDRRRGNRRLAESNRDLAQRIVHDIAAGVDAVHRRPLMTVRQDRPVFGATNAEIVRERAVAKRPERRIQRIEPMVAPVSRLQTDDCTLFAMNLGYGRLDELDTGLLELAPLIVGNACRAE